MKSALTLGVVSLIAAAPLDMPDPTATPGTINPAVTQTNISQTICVRGWTATVRPPVEYTSRLKRQMLSNLDPRDYELDHLVPLELGGHPTDPRNLWPELWSGACGAHVKDKLENTLHRLVCGGRITLWQAQTEIAGDWEASYRKRIGPLDCGHP